MNLSRVHALPVTVEVSELRDGAPFPGNAKWHMPIRRFDAYDPDAEEWPIYQERLEQLIYANGFRQQTNIGGGKHC